MILGFFLFNVMNFRRLHKKYLDSDRVKVAASKIEKLSQIHDKIVKSWFHMYQQDWGKSAKTRTIICGSPLSERRECEAVVIETDTETR